MVSLINSTECIMLIDDSDAGVDGVVVENMWDAPYVTSSGPEVTAVMAVVCSAVRAAVRREVPVGVQESIHLYQYGL